MGKVQVQELFSGVGSAYCNSHNQVQSTPINYAIRNKVNKRINVPPTYGRVKSTSIVGPI